MKTFRCIREGDERGGRAKIMYYSLMHLHRRKNGMLPVKNRLTIDGSQLNEAGYKKLGILLADQIFGKAARQSRS